MKYNKLKFSLVIIITIFLSILYIKNLLKTSTEINIDMKNLIIEIEDLCQNSVIAEELKKLLYKHYNRFLNKIDVEDILYIIRYTIKISPNLKIGIGINTDHLEIFCDYYKQKRLLWLQTEMLIALMNHNPDFWYDFINLLKQNNLQNTNIYIFCLYHVKNII